jgi:phage gpG-like protein
LGFGGDVTVVQITSFGIDAFVEKLEGVTGRIGFATPALWTIVQDMQRVEEQVFLSQGRRGGGSWKFLSPEYRARKERQGESPLILIATGDLMESVTESEGRYSDVVVTNNIIVFGTSHPGAATQQFGDTSRNIPARPFLLRFTEYDRARWRRILLDYFLETTE